MSRYKQADRERQLLETRKQLLQAAAAEFASQGYERANIDSISQAAGCAKGTIYNYFATKRVLMLELIDEIVAGHAKFIAEQLRQAGDPAHKLERFFEAGISWSTENPSRARVMIATLNGPDVEFKTRINAGYRPILELLNSEILDTGIQHRVFRPVDQAPTAELLMILYLGAISQLDGQGKPRLALAQVTEFALNALGSNPSSIAKES